MKALSEFVKVWLKLNFRDPARIIIGILLPILVLVIWGKMGSFPDAEAKTSFTLKLLAFFIVSGNVDLITLVELREKGILRKLHTTPLSAASFLTSHMLARLFLSLLTAGFVFAVAVVWWRLSLVENLLSLTFVIALSSLVFITLGDLIVSITPSSETAFALGPLIFLPMVIFGEVFFKFERGIFWFISQIVPSTYLVRAFEKITLRAGALGDATGELGVLTLWVAGTLLLAVKLFRWE